MPVLCRRLGYAILGLVATLAAADNLHAQWGHHRVVTSYSFPSTPVYRPAVPVHSFYGPVIVAPAAAVPVVSAPVAASPPIIVSQPQTAYYAPAPVTAFYAAPVVAQPVVVARPAYFPRRGNVYSFVPARAAAAYPVIVP